MNREPANPTAVGVQPGDTVGKYEVVDQIGAGGSSVVWRGRDPLLDRTVAIKQFHLDSEELEAGEDLRERLSQEAELQKRVSANGKHLVRVLELLSVPQGVFLVMEYVEGESLAHYMQRNQGPMELKQALGLVGGIAMGLQAIHEQDVIHRDLKPSNVLLPKRGGLKICDFGLATLVGEAEQMEAGTVRYMAPELLRNEEADQRADLYSLGMIAYELLAGREGYEKAFKMVLRDQRNPALRWMKWHTNPRAKAPPLRTLRPEVPQAVSDLVARMMEKDPDQRVWSARELLEALRRLFAHQSGGRPGAGVDAAGAAASAARTQPGRLDDPETFDDVASPAEATEKLPPRSRVPYILTGLLVFWLCVAGGIWYWQQEKAGEQREQMLRADQEAFQEARELYHEENYAEARQMFQNLADKWGSAPTLGRGSRVRAKLCEARMLENQNNFDDALDAYLAVDKMRILDRDLIQQAIQRVKDKEAFRTEAELIERKIADRQFGEAQQRLAQLRDTRLTEQQEATLDELGSRLEDQKTLAKIDDVLSRVSTLVDSGRQQEALNLLEQTQQRYNHHKLRTRAAEIGKDMRLRDLLAEAERAEGRGDLADAIEAFQAAQQVDPDKARAQRIRRLQSQQALQAGMRAKAEGNMTEAVAAFQRALSFADSPEATEQLQQIEQANKQDLAISAGDQAASAGNYQTAIEHYQRALEIGPAPRVNNKIRELRVRLAVEDGNRHLNAGELGPAKQAYQQALQLDPGHREASRKLDRVETRQEYELLVQAGHALRRQSRLAEAKTQYVKARDLIETDEVEQLIEETEFDSLIANAKRDMAAEKWEAARAWLRTAQRIEATDEVERLLEEVQANAGFR